MTEMKVMGYIYFRKDIIYTEDIYCTRLVFDAILLHVIEFESHMTAT